MTTFVLFDSDYSPTGVVRRIREEFARHGIKSDARAAALADRKQQWLQRLMSGQQDWRMSELQDFCAALGLDFLYVVAGIRSLPSGGGVPQPPMQVPSMPRRHPRRGRTTGIRIISAIEPGLGDVA